MNFRLLVALVLAGTASAHADSREDVLDAMGKCAVIADDKARLACYDALSPHVKDVLASPPGALPGNRPPTREEQESWFGFNLDDLFGAGPSQQTTPQQFGSDRLPETQAKVETAQHEVESITAGVTSYAYTPFGKFVVFLDNGQVWRQLEGDADHANFHHTAKDNKVTITRGMLGSYNLMINDSDRVFKVSRVK